MFKVEIAFKGYTQELLEDAVDILISILAFMGIVSEGHLVYEVKEENSNED